MVWEILRRARVREVGREFECIGLGLAGGMVAHLIYGIADAVALGEKGGVVFWGVLGLTAGIGRAIRFPRERTKEAGLGALFRLRHLGIFEEESRKGG